MRAVIDARAASASESEYHRHARDCIACNHLANMCSHLENTHNRLQARDCIACNHLANMCSRLENTHNRLQARDCIACNITARL